MKPLVSIIIPTYNRAHLIGETLDSVIAQTYINWECIIVDDGSVDNTINVLSNYAQKDKRIKYYKRPKNRRKGANACRNYGFEKSKGDYIQWFDSDDFMHFKKLETKVSTLINTHYDFVVCEGIEYKDDITNIIREWNKIFSNNILEDHITGRVNFHTNGPLFKREFLNNKKLFNEFLMRKQEWEFYSRLLTLSTNYKPIYKVLYYFRSHSDSINGKNDIATLKSRIVSNQLVFSLVKKNFNKEKQKALSKHFFYKYLDFFRIAKKSKNQKLIHISLMAIISHLTFIDLLKGAFKTIYKPHILNNFFQKNENR